MQVEQVKKQSIAPPLGNIPKFASGVDLIEHFKNEALGEEAKPEDKKPAPARFRHFLAMQQRNILTKKGLFAGFKNLFLCGSSSIPAKVRRKDGTYWETKAPGVVQVVRHEGAREDGKDGFGFAWVRKCASALLCFCCAPKIHYKRSQEVELVSNIMWDYGYRWLFVTFTCRHDWTADPVRQVELFQEAQRKMRAGRRFQAWKERWGYEHQIRSVEMTDDSPDAKYKTGCHFHNHIIMFFKHSDFTEKECQQCRNELSEMWLEALKKVGLWDGVAKKEFMEIRAVVAKCPRKNKKKTGTEAARYAAKGAACEMTPGIFSKFGRLPARISHWEVMALAFTRRPDMISRAVSIMRALKGRSWLQFSRGLKDLCGLEDKTDEELMKESTEQIVYEFDEENRQWRHIDKFKQQAALREALEEYGEKNSNIGEACDYFTELIEAGYDPLSDKAEKLEATQQVDNFVADLGRFNDIDPMTGYPFGATFPPGAWSGKLFAGFRRRKPDDEINQCLASMADPYFGMTDEQLFYAMAGQP